LAALGGAYPSSTVPLLVGAGGVFLFSRARIAAAPETRRLDVLLLAALTVIFVQIVPLPAAIVGTLSPAARALQQMLAVGAEPVRSISIDPRLTRLGLATAASALLLFWAARDVLARGGLRLFARTLAIAGFAVALIGLVQRTSSPSLLLWHWEPLDAGAKPFGLFVNRNHFGTWLLMAASVTGGYLIAHLRSHRLEEHTSARLIARDLIADGSALFLGGALGVMLLALVASLSRAALLGTVAALVFAFAATRGRKREASLAVGVAVLSMAILAAVWLNREGLLGRINLSATEVGRPVIWAETLPLLKDFWLTGTGVGTYGTAMLRYQQTRSDTWFNQAHNEYLQLMAEGGVLLAVPVIGALAVWFGVARRRLLANTDHIEWIRIGAAAGLCGVAVQSVFETGLRMPANGFLCAVLAAIVVHESRHA
jgi:putative inorganic carbon (HCO3(-)) transporter